MARRAPSGSPEQNLGGYGSQAHLADLIRNLIVRHAETTANCELATAGVDVKRT
jgi:hypothetical protein